MSSETDNQGSAKHTASELINEFFEALHDREGMDSDTAQIVKRLWQSDSLTRETLLRSLEKHREQNDKNAPPAD